jgi:hypothetical protein
LQNLFLNYSTYRQLLSNIKDTVWENHPYIVHRLENIKNKSEAFQNEQLDLTKWKANIMDTITNISNLITGSKEEENIDGEGTNEEGDRLNVKETVMFFYALMHILVDHKKMNGATLRRFISSATGYKMDGIKKAYDARERGYGYKEEKDYKASVEKVTNLLTEFLLNMREEENHCENLKMLIAQINKPYQKKEKI